MILICLLLAVLLLAVSAALYAESPRGGQRPAVQTAAPETPMRDANEGEPFTAWDTAGEPPAARE